MIRQHMMERLARAIDDVDAEIRKASERATMHSPTHDQTASDDAILNAAAILVLVAAIDEVTEAVRNGGAQ